MISRMAMEDDVNLRVAPACLPEWLEKTISFEGG
jgi:hypothetical protein